MPLSLENITEKLKEYLISNQLLENNNIKIVSNGKSSSIVYTPNLLYNNSRTSRDTEIILVLLPSQKIIITLSSNENVLNSKMFKVSDEKLSTEFFTNFFTNKGTYGNTVTTNSNTVTTNNNTPTKTKSLADPKPGDVPRSSSTNNDNSINNNIKNPTSTITLLTDPVLPSNIPDTNNGSDFNINSVPKFEDEYEIQQNARKSTNTRHLLQNYGDQDLNPLGIKSILNTGDNSNNVSNGGMIFDPFRGGENNANNNNGDGNTGPPFPGARYSDPFGHGTYNNGSNNGNGFI
ncbi:Fub1p SCDLUD_003749 [Saccharomycodes ludwigii]|uniref:Fub1p n=1 Tax=Saccharomycodes ludwigii TaxID=36035 RepID=UPI001E866A26|nr:hypothetical protein SCDLUD_003749 [Saccharomycodes ludwigii]KAH3900744.1 hypothetical protein SCDLUD_003749 [Saccharomycodes ludwigii]